MNPNDVLNLLKPIGHDEAKRKLNQAFVQKVRDALDNDCGDIDAMRQAYQHGHYRGLGRLISASMDIYNEEFGDSDESQKL